MNKISPQNWAWVDLNSADQCKYLIANLLRTDRIKDIESLSDYAARVLENLKDDAEASKNAHKGWRRQLNKTTHSNNNASDVNSALSQSSATINTTNNEQPTPEAPLRRPYSAQIDYSHLSKYPPHTHSPTENRTSQANTAVRTTNTPYTRNYSGHSFDIYFREEDRPRYNKAVNFREQAMLDRPLYDGAIYSDNGVQIGQRFYIMKNWS